MPGEVRQPSVYAIIVNYNGWRDTIECLESLLRSDTPSLQIVVCDNGSTDASLQQLRDWAEGRVQIEYSAGSALRHLTSPPVLKPIAFAEYTRGQLEQAGARDLQTEGVIFVSCGANLGFAGANNVGLRYVMSCRPDAYALLFNNDAIIAPNAISEMVRIAESAAEVGCVGATILEYRDPERVEALAGATLSFVHGMAKLINEGTPRSAPRLQPSRMDFISGCCMLVPGKTLERVGLMDERYFLYGEDADWGLRITKAGLKLAYCAVAEVWHKGGSSVVHKSVVHDYYDVRGRLMLVHKHFPAMLPAALLYSAGRCALPKLARGEWARLRAVWRGYGDFVRQTWGRKDAARRVGSAA